MLYNKDFIFFSFSSYFQMFFFLKIKGHFLYRTCLCYEIGEKCPHCNIVTRNQLLADDLAVQGARPPVEWTLTRGAFQKRLWALKYNCIKTVSYNVWVRYFVWNFKVTLWNSTQNILPIHWKMCILFTGEYLRTLRFKSLWAFLKCPPRPWFYQTGWDWFTD